GWHRATYYIAGRTKNGKRYNLSTGHTDLAKAEEFYKNWMVANPDLVPGVSISVIEAEARQALREYERRRKWLGLDHKPRPEPDPVVYFIQVGDTAPIKIGSTLNISQRLSGLQTSHTETLRLLTTIPADRFTERRILEQFKELRIRGEWHRPEPELLRFIG